MEINLDVSKELFSFESSELERLLNTLEDNLLYANALNSINGGYSTATAYDIDEDEEGGVIFIEVEFGEQDMGGGWSSSNKGHCKVARNVLGDKEMSIRDKLEAIDWE